MGRSGLCCAVLVHSTPLLMFKEPQPDSWPMIRPISFYGIIPGLKLKGGKLTDLFKGRGIHSVISLKLEPSEKVALAVAASEQVVGVLSTEDLKNKNKNKTHGSTALRPGPPAAHMTGNDRCWLPTLEPNTAFSAFVRCRDLHHAQPCAGGWGGSSSNKACPSNFTF